MKFSAASILQRQVAYTWCYADAAWRLYQAKITGDVSRQSAEKNRMILIDKALDVLCAYQIDGQDCHTQYASSYEDVCCMIGLVDPCCVSCGCPPGLPIDVCSPRIAHNVISAVDIGRRASIEAGPPTEGDAYLTVSGGVMGTDGVWSINSVVTWTSGVWVSVFLTNGINVRASDTGVIWTTKDNATPGHLFPVVTAILDSGPPSVYNLVSDYPVISQNSNRIVQVEIRLQTGGWFLAYQGQEQTIATPYQLNIGGLDMQTIRVTYFDGLCRTTVGGVTIPPIDGCGILVAQATTSCNGEGFNVNVYIESAAGFILGNIIATVGGSPVTTTPAILGTTIIGPFDRNDSVEITITNSYDSECNYAAGVLTHPSFPMPQYVVRDAVDASFEASYVSGSYLVVSSNGLSSLEWVSNVGSIWNGTVWITPDENDITFASEAPVERSYWQMVSGIEVPIFGQAKFNRNIITGEWRVEPFEPIAPYLAGTNILATAGCSGSLIPVHFGPIEGFVEEAFVSGCGPELTGNVSYLFLCPIDVPGITGEYAPPLETGQLNSYVYSLRIQNDHSILVGGLFTNYGATSAKRHTRLLPTGVLDTAYNSNVTSSAGFNKVVTSIYYDSAGRSIVTGSFTTLNGVLVGYVVRLLDDGTLDPSFAIQSTPNPITTANNGGASKSITLQDGTIIVVGSFREYNGLPAGGIIALKQDGTIETDWNFGTGIDAVGGAGRVINGVVEMPDGGIMIYGYFNSYNGNNMTWVWGGLLRLLPGGAIDTSFVTGSGAIGNFSNDISEVSLMPDGRLLAVGGFNAFDGNAAPQIVMLNQDGSIDPTFMAGVGAGYGFLRLRCTTPLPDGRIAIGVDQTNIGYTDHNFLITILRTGERDMSFVRDINYSVYCMVYEPSTHSLLLGGGFTVVDGVNQNYVTRIDL